MAVFTALRCKAVKNSRCAAIFRPCVSVAAATARNGAVKIDCFFGHVSRPRAAAMEIRLFFCRPSSPLVGVIKTGCFLLHCNKKYAATSLFGLPRLEEGRGSPDKPPFIAER